MRPGDLITREDMDLPAPAPGSIQVPGANETNAYGFLVSDALDLANSAYLAGEHNKATRDVRGNRRGGERSV